MRVAGGNRFQPVPSAPGNVSAGAISTSDITLTWSAAKDAFNRPIDYLIFADGSTGPIATVSALTFTHSGLTANSTHAYQIIARATPAVGNTVLSAKSSIASATTQSSSVGGPVITDLWVALQGQTAPGQATIGGTNNSQLFGSSDSMTLAGTIQAGDFPVASVNLYRSEDLFATRVKVNASPIPVTGGAFSYRDDTAVNCVATFCGGSSNPQSGAPAKWWPARAYRYKAEAVDSQGTVGVLSASHKMYVYRFNSGGQNVGTINGNPAGGMKWGSDLGGGLELAYNDTGLSESGNSILFGSNAGYWLPTSGWIFPQWSKQVGGTDYFYIDIHFATVGQLTLHAELNPNDHKIDLLAGAHAAAGNAPGNPSLDLTGYMYAVDGVPDARWPNVPFAAIPAGKWVTFKVPRTHYMTDAGTLQDVVYKFLINIWGGSIGTGTRGDMIYYGP